MFSFLFLFLLSYEVYSENKLPKPFQWEADLMVLDHHQSIKKYDFSIHDIQPTDDYYHLDQPTSIPDSGTDEEGVPMFTKNDEQYNHPVRIAHNMINLLTSYQMTDNEEYLKRAKVYANRLVEIGTYRDGAMYFPYEFEVTLHDIPSERLAPPWYSGMAQGQALSAFTRLYQITQDPEHRKWADQTFKSFTQLKAEDHPRWIAMIDNEYYWIEEYPLEKSTKVLNGYIFAIFGIYDYYQIHSDQQVKDLLQASLTTIYDHIHLYRINNEASLYGLKHDHQSVHYHIVHMEQLEVLHQMTNEPYFREMKEVFHKDWYGIPAKIKRIPDKVKRGWKKGIEQIG